MRAVAGLRRLFHILIVSSAALFLCGAAHAQDRIALVIGNATYSNVPRLPNTANDAADMAAAFKQMGFAVTTVFDAGYDTMRRALLDFSRGAGRAEFAVVYFAGHGIETSGQNYLIPVDAEFKYDRDVGQESISLHNVMEAVAVARRLGLVILDACRNDPFRSRMLQTAGVTRSVSRGLARVDATGNVMVAFAAREGMVADDGGSLIVLASLPPAARPSSSVAPAPPTPAAPPAGGPTAGGTVKLFYSGWTKFCGPPPNRSDVAQSIPKTMCFTGTDVRDARNVMVLEVVLIEMEGQPRKVFHVTLPFGMSTSSGAQLVIDQGTPLQAPSMSCSKETRCMSDFDMSPDLLAKLKTGRLLTIKAFDAQNQPVSVPLLLKDFAATNDGPVVDYSVYLSQQKKVEDEVRAYAEQARKQTGRQ